jgi:hypothetical protein
MEFSEAEESSRAWTVVPEGHAAGGPAATRASDKNDGLYNFFVITI